MLTVNLVGAFFRPPAKFLLEVLPAGSPLKLVPEPENPYDEHAIAVYGSAAEASLEALARIAGKLEGCGHGLPDDLEERAAWLETERHLGYVAKEQTAGIRASASGSGPWPGALAFNAEGKPQVKISTKEEV